VGGASTCAAVRSEDDALVSDERVKRDPVLSFEQPVDATLDETTGIAVVNVALTLYDFDGAVREASGAMTFRLRDRDVPEDEGFVFTLELTSGHATLTLQLDTPCDLVITAEPPFVADLQLAQPINVKVNS
jgi:hypothetical protein